MRAENNKVELTGTIITEPEFNHAVSDFGKEFNISQKTKLKAMRYLWRLLRVTARKEYTC